MLRNRLLLLLRPGREQSQVGFWHCGGFLRSLFFVLVYRLEWLREEGEMDRMDVLDGWNSRSSWRSVWPKSPYTYRHQFPTKLRCFTMSCSHLCVDVYDDIVASVGHFESRVWVLGPSTLLLMAVEMGSNSMMCRDNS